MFKNIKKQIGFGLLLIVIHSTAFANERWYRIELLIMEHKDKSGVLLEEWPIDPGYPSVSQAYYLQSFTGDREPDNFIELPKDQYDLLDARQRLVKRTGNKILLHKAWRQKVKENQPEPIRFKGGGSYIYNPDGEDKSFRLLEFDGTLTIILSRYLHVNADLVFHKPMQVLEKISSYAHESMQKLKPLSNEANWEAKIGVDLQRFRLTEKRKIKKNEVMYIDHPMYGIMIKISDDREQS